MQPQRAGGKYASFHQLFASCLFGRRSRLMGVDLFRHEPVNDGDNGNASKEGTDGGLGASGFSPEGVGKLGHAFGENLHEGDVEHDPGRKT